jgi:hypothetical protein
MRSLATAVPVDGGRSGHNNELRTTQRVSEIPSAEVSLAEVQVDYNVERMCNEGRKTFRVDEQGCREVLAEFPLSMGTAVR